MNEGTMQEWPVADGARVKEAQPRYLTGSEKSVREIESPAFATRKLIGGIGEVYPVGAVLAVVS
jgi:pyruvate/2-oxoglutarate dehydrogenase complex dihydrolipoamide acyltransferase (E2) component